MELYNDVGYELSERLTLRYSTSFGMSSRLFAATIRRDIYAIYGLVRVADEIVDTYRGDDKGMLLDDLENETYQALARGYSTNPIVQAFILTANRYGIAKDLIEPFFASMRMDVTPANYDASQYETYIYGSAEVVGLMCLKVFVNGNGALYDTQAPAARALGAAYQKVNFLRDFAVDVQELGRTYFPGVTYDTFDETTKATIIADIQRDFAVAERGIADLPMSARKAVRLSYRYYRALLTLLEITPVAEIKQRRIRIAGWRKLLLFIAVKVGV